MLVGPDNRAVDHRILVIGLGRQGLQHSLPNPALGPASEPSMDILPTAKALGQLAPRNSGAIAIEDRFDKATVVLGGGADVSRASPGASP